MKKQMKRLMLGLMLLGTGVLAGCGNADTAVEQNAADGKTIEEYVQEAKESLETADSFSADFKNVLYDDSGAFTLDTKVIWVKDPLNIKVDTYGVDEKGGTQHSVTYLERGEGDAVNLYMNTDGGQWTEMTMTEENALDTVLSNNALEHMRVLLSAAEDWKLTGDAKGDLVTATAVIPEEKVYAVEEGGKFFWVSGMIGLPQTHYQGVGDMPLTFVFQRRTGEPVSYELDMAKALETVTNNILRELDGGKLEDAMTVSVYTASCNITQLNGVKAEPIPAGGKNNAINYEKEISLLQNVE